MSIRWTFHAIRQRVPGDFLLAAVAQVLEGRALVGDFALAEDQREGGAALIGPLQLVAETAAAAIRAIVRTQAALKADPERATEVGRRLFPPAEAELIAGLVRRDLPYYDAAISPEFVAGMSQFCRDLGILHAEPAYERVVAARFSALWHS